MRLTNAVIPVVVSIGCLASCGSGVANPISAFRPAYENTVFTAIPSNNERLVAPVVENHTNESPPRFMMSPHEFGGLGIEVGYQYIGRGVIEAPGVMDAEPRVADVYLVSIRTGKQAIEYEAVWYNGEDEVVLERPGIKVMFGREGNNE